MLLLLVDHRAKNVVCQLTRNKVYYEMDIYVSVILLQGAEATANEAPTLGYVNMLLNEPNIISMCRIGQLRLWVLNTKLTYPHSSPLISVYMFDYTAM